MWLTPLEVGGKLVLYMANAVVGDEKNDAQLAAKVTNFFFFLANRQPFANQNKWPWPLTTKARHCFPSWGETMQWGRLGMAMR